MDWCREEADKLLSWGVKKIVFAGNKCDAEFELDLDDANAWFEERKIKNLFVCATNNIGTEELFIEMDRVDMDLGGSVYMLNCL